jgi:hypothetical protein
MHLLQRLPLLAHITLPERLKFRGGHTRANSSIIQLMVDQNMLFLPTTFDHLGCPGPLAHRFLFGSPTHNPGFPLDTYTSCRLPINTQTLIAHATSPSALSGLLPAADEAFRHTCPRRWYGNTYHTLTPPHQLSVQFLGLTLTRAYARHLDTARA